jgi:membrane protein DedA with SNARE-associated domain
VDQLAQTLIGLVRDNRDWAFWLALALATAETTAFVSVLVPSTVILAGLGAMVATGALDFGPIWAGASLGALIGSLFSYGLGLRYGDRMLAVWPLSRDPALVQRGRDVFARRGSVAVGLGHFLTFLRPVVFLMAGAAGMRPRVFLPWTVAGGTAWAFAVPKSGEVGGDLIGWLWRAAGGG